ERTDRYRQTRLAGIITFILAAILISYVFNGFTSSVKHSQARIVTANEQLQRDILGLLDVVSNAADGDLTARAKVGEGTLGNVADAFNQMMESWQQLVGAIKLQLDRTGLAVGELRQAAATMANGASRQAGEVVDATNSVQRMSDEIHRVSGNAENAAAAAKRTQESALQGSSSVQNVVLGMDTLRSLVQAGAKKVKTLGDRSMEITSIVGAITKISEQTNMLALNAAIEAARAGDQGRGFSVVADEVRKLAERTALATQEIDKLVRNIQAETTESVHAIERQTQVVEDEGRAVATAGSALVKIQDASSQSSSLANDIAAIAKTQVADAQSVVGTMQRISSIARETEGSAQGSLTIVKGLNELSEQLRSSIGRFKVR
ncbi:MAG TPA: methyl-accepting chemotaxis protein, partial [Planctomycetota bacterium]|nr:methyl-accepting chemotaxis protein [Planctomycetota bacterium]